MSFTSKKPLIKQGSIFDSESKQRPGISTKRVSFGSTLLSDSDEENSLGRENRRPLKKNEDDDDLLNLFKNELSDSDEDELVVGTKGNDKPRPKPRQKSETKTIEDLSQAKQTENVTDDLEQTINPKRKPRQPPPRKRTGDSQSEDLETENHEIAKPKVLPRHSNEQPLSAAQRKSEDVLKKEFKSRLSLDDSDDDLIVTSSKKTSEKVNRNKEIEIRISKPEVETQIEENVLLSSSSKHKQFDSKGALNENKSRKSKNKSILSKTDPKSSEDEEDLHVGKNNLMTNKGRKGSIDDKRGKNENKVHSKLSEFENEGDLRSKRREKELHKMLDDDSDDNDADGKRRRGRKTEKGSVQLKASEFENEGDLRSKRREKELHKMLDDDSDDNDADGKRRRGRKTEKGSVQLKASEFENEDTISKRRQKDKALVTPKVHVDDSDDNEAGVRRTKGKNESNSVDHFFGSKKSQNDKTISKALQDDSDDNEAGIRRTKGKNESNSVDHFFGSKKSQNDKTISNMLQDDSDDDSIKRTRGKIEKGSARSKLLTSEHEDNMSSRKSQKDKSNAFSKLSLDDSDDEDDVHIQNQKVRTRKLSKEKNEIQDKSVKYKDGIQVPQPRKRHKDTAKISDSRKTIINDRDVDSDEEKGDTLSTTKSTRTRKEHNAENTSLRSGLHSKLHYLDDDDDDDEKGFQVKSQQKTSGKTKTTDKHEAKKVVGWSSLDESEDDDEAVGKRITLQKTKPSSSKQQESQIPKQTTPKPSPRSTPKPSPRSTPKPSPRSSPKPSSRSSPQPKPRHRDRNMKTDRTQEENVIEKDYKSNRYDVNQNLPRDKRDINERQSYRGRVTPQRPSSSRMRQNNDWSRHEDDITDMFEEHVPDASDVVGTAPDMDRTQRSTRDYRRPQSAVTPKKGPMKADLRIEEMTKSPQLRQTMDYYENEDQDWRSENQRSFGKQRSSSLTNLNQTGRTYYAGYDSDDDGRRNSLDTQSIRQTVYDNWLSRKNVTIKKELSKKALQKQKEEKLAREQREKKRSAELAFKSWSEHKNETLKEQQAKRRAEKKQEKDKELEKELKKRDATKYFESWKSKKDVIIKETHKEKMKEKMEKKKKEEEDKMEKTVSSKKSFENWKSKKDDILKQQHKDKKKQEKLEGTKKQEEEYEKTIKNADEFHKWVENKGKPRKKPPSPTLTQRAWVPGSRHTADCIPSKVQPVVLPPSSNRARTLSGTFRATKKYYDY